MIRTIATYRLLCRYIKHFVTLKMHFSSSKAPRRLRIWNFQYYNLFITYLKMYVGREFRKWFFESLLHQFWVKKTPRGNMNIKNNIMRHSINKCLKWFRIRCYYCHAIEYYLSNLGIFASMRIAKFSTFMHSIEHEKQKKSELRKMRL